AAVLNEIYGTSRARSYDANTVQRTVQHHWPQGDLVLHAQLRKLRYHYDKVRCIRRASCNALLQFLAHAIHQPERAFLVLRIDDRLEPVRRTKQLLRQASKATQDHES